MRQSGVYYELASAVAPRTIVSSTDATPIVVTLTGHPYSTGDEVMIVGHTINTNANGRWTITKVNANSFSLDNSTATGGGAGGAAGVVTDGLGQALDVSDYKTVVFYFASDGGGDAAYTVSVRGSIEDDAPDFHLAASASNRWSAVELIDLEGNDAIEGDTGIALATADDYRLIEVNVNALKWVCPIVVAGTAGELTMSMRAFYE